jgi:hypothetical protein
VALAAPVPALELVSGRERLVVPLEGTTSVRYTYVHSIYRVRVQEDYAAEGGGLRLLHVRTNDRRVIEYLGWPGEPRRENGSYVQEPPDARAGELVVRVSPDARQEIAVDGQRIGLEERFGAELLRIRRTTASRAAWLLGFGR